MVSGRWRTVGEKRGRGRNLDLLKQHDDLLTKQLTAQTASVSSSAVKTATKIFLSDAPPSDERGRREWILCKLSMKLLCTNAMR